jgi:hypothetical protein
MKSVAKILCLLLVTAASVNAAQLYRWVDSRGNVEWRDTPPPASVPTKDIQQRHISDSAAGTSEIQFSLQLATKNHPVTLWATDCGPICSSARAHLGRRGIPFTDKVPQTDFEAFKKLSPGAEIPLLQVGVITLKGYSEGEWDSTLDSAGYPRTAIATRPKPPVTPPAGKPSSEGAKPADAGTPPAAPPAAVK